MLIAKTVLAKILNQLKIVIMKKILFLLTIIISSISYAQEINKPSSLDGVIKHQRNNYIDFAKSTRAITRASNRVSIKLDSIVYFLPEKENYYVNFIVDLYEDKSSEPLTSLSYLIKDIVTERKGDKKKNILTNQVFASGLSFEKAKFLKLRCQLIKMNDKEDAINNTLNGFLKKIVESVPYVDLINNLLESQNDNDDEILFFNQEYDVPLNNVEYTFKKQSDDSPRLLSSATPIYIPINSSINNEYLNPSIAGFIFKTLCKAASVTTGITASDGKTYKFDGMIKLRITNDDNLNIPDYLQNPLEDYALSITPSNISTSEFKTVKDKLKEALRSFKESNSYDKKIFFSIQQLMILGESYQMLLEKETVINGGGAPGSTEGRLAFQELVRTFREFYDRTSHQQAAFDFLAYGIYNTVYENEWARIFIPYNLTDIANNEMIRWQINIHEKLNDYNSGEFKIPFSQ